MKLFKWEILSTKQVQHDRTEYRELRDTFDYVVSHVNKGNDMEAYRTPDGYMGERPNIATRALESDWGARIPLFPFQLERCYQMAHDIDALRIPIDVLNREMVRNGFDVLPRYQYKCNRCKKEYQNKPEIPAVNVSEAKEELKCDVCGNKSFKKPKPAGRQKLMDLLEKKVNNNKQSLKQVIKQIERDLEIADFAAMLLIKKYEKDSKEKKFRKSEIEEIIRVNPSQTFVVANTEGRFGHDNKGNEVYFCPVHRDKKVTAKQGEVPRCDTCGYECLKAYLEINSLIQGFADNPKRIFYGLQEAIVCHGKYEADMLYGYSPIFTVWSKALAMQFMDEYVRKYFDKMRPPKSLLVIGSRNYQSLQKAFDDIKQKAKNDPYGIHPLMVETERGGRAMVQYVNLTDSLSDLQFTDVRDEYRRSIGALYGVTGLFGGDVPEGWNQEGMQAMVTNRVIEWGQEVLFESFFEPLALMLNVTDWVIRLKAGEEVDELRDEQLENQRIANAAAMQGMGFGVERTAEGKFVYTLKIVKEPEEGGGGKTEGQPPRDEVSTGLEGTPQNKRPSDAGGIGEGHPASGDNTSLSQR